MEQATDVDEIQFESVHTDPATRGIDDSERREFPKSVIVFPPVTGAFLGRAPVSSAGNSSN
jgi:hypothetical protein